MAKSIGYVSSGSGKNYEVQWDSSSGTVYVKFTGGVMLGTGGAQTRAGSARSEAEALQVAEQYVASK